MGRSILEFSQGLAGPYLGHRHEGRSARYGYGPVVKLLGAAQQDPEPQKKPAATKKPAQQKPEPQKKPAATQNSTAAKDQGHGLPRSSSSVDVAMWAMRILGKSGRFSELRSSVEKRDGQFRLGSLCSGMGTEMIAATGQRLSRVAHILPHNADSQYVL
jgi:hypothetical protein